MQAALRFLAVSETARIKGEDARITKRTRLSREDIMDEIEVCARDDECLDPLIAKSELSIDKAAARDVATSTAIRLDLVPY